MHVGVSVRAHVLKLSYSGQLDSTLCVGIVDKASMWCVWGHMEKLLDNGALVLLASTKRPRQAQTGGQQPRWGVCVRKRERVIMGVFLRFCVRACNRVERSL